MVGVNRPVEPEQRLAEALRARATGAGRVGFGGAPPPRAAATGPGTSGARTALLLALAAGLLVGVLLALLSLLAPGVLPPLG
jgi:hypothetical protein